MTLELKASCQKFLLKIESRIYEIVDNFKKKKVFHIEKIVQHLSNDFIFLSQQLKIVWDQLSYLQRKNQENIQLVAHYEQQIQAKENEIVRIKKMMKFKCNKLSKQLNFIHFSNKNLNKKNFNEQNDEILDEISKGDYLKNQLDQLKKQMVQTNNRVCFKVTQIKNKIQSENTRYLTEQFKPKTLNQYFQKQVSDISVQPISSPLKITKVIKLDQSPYMKTKKKQFIKQNNDATFNQKGKSKKNELAALISQQGKVQVNKQQYLSTNI